MTQGYPDEHDIGRYYESDDYISLNDAAGGLINRIYSISRNIMLHRKHRVVENAANLKKGSILDIGCGTGYFAGRMKKNGWDVTGIEPNKKARDFGSQRFGLRVIGPDQISALPDRSFDVVTMWHVMEHFHNPFSYAGEILRLLRPGGLCISALPNCSSYDAKYYGESWAAYDVPRHLWHFTPETYRIFAEKTGFQITLIRSLPLDVFYISVLSEKNKGTRFYFITGMLKGFLFACRSLFTHRKSSSLIYFLHRK